LIFSIRPGFIPFYSKRVWEIDKVNPIFFGKKSSIPK